MSHSQLLLTLELDTSAEPIRGTLRERGEPARTFDGWMGLTAALQAVVSRSRAGSESETAAACEAPRRRPAVD